MKRICWLLLLAGLCPALRAEAREPFAGSAKKPPAGIISVDLRGDTLVYLSVPGRRGLYVDAEGQRYRFRPEPAVVGPPHALSFEIGAFAASGMRGMFYTGGCCDDSGYPRFPGEFPGEQRYYEGPLRTTGALGIAYGYRVKHWLEVGASFTYTGFYRNLLRTSDGGVASRQREHYLTLMPYVRLSWVNGRMVQCYSSLHPGVSTGKRALLQYEQIGYGRLFRRASHIGGREGRAASVRLWRDRCRHARGVRGRHRLPVRKL